MQTTGSRCRNAEFRKQLIGALMIWSMVSVKVGECNMIKKGVPETSFITNFVQKYIQPYIQSLQLRANTPKPRSVDKTPVHKAIHEVVENLKLFLQDNEKHNKLVSDDTDETTIIEILPKTNHNIVRVGEEPGKNASSDLQKSIRKYKKIKLEIKAALERDSVAEKTKKMVTRTLDDLIAQVIGNQCIWKSVDHSNSFTFRNGKNVNHNITLEEWKDLKKRYMKFLEKEQLDKSMVLFDNFHNFFSKVINDTENLSKRYKIKCQIVGINGTDKTTYNKQNIRNNEMDNCEDFQICSKELNEFLLHFYNSLNETTVSVFKNYAAMYMKDVISDGADSKEVDSVPNIITNMLNSVEHRVGKVFFQELKKLRLNKRKEREANIKILRKFIEETCQRVHKHVKKHLENDLGALKARLLITVRKDLNMNLGVDLENLEADLKEIICTVFITCNSRISASRRSGSGEPRINPNSIYVKVKLTLNDKLKYAIAKTQQNILKMSNMSETFRRNYQNDYSNHNVTRTTIRVESTLQTSNSNFSKFNEVLMNSIIEKF